jgi:hypothetical protein
MSTSKSPAGPSNPQPSSSSAPPNDPTFDWHAYNDLVQPLVINILMNPRVLMWGAQECANARSTVAQLRSDCPYIGDEDLEALVLQTLDMVENTCEHWLRFLEGKELLETVVDEVFKRVNAKLGVAGGSTS